MHLSKSSTILARGEQPKNMKKQYFDIQARGRGHLPGLPNG